MRLKLIAYNKKQIKPILEAIGVDWKWFGFRLYYKGKRLLCKSCGKKLTVWSIAQIAPRKGKSDRPVLYCESLLCACIFVTDYEVE